MNNDLLVKIAGFYIKIVYSKTDWKTIRKQYINKMNDYFRGFIVKDNIECYDYQINFIWENEIENLYFEKEKKCFIKLFQKNKNNSLTCSYRLGILEFQKLLIIILLELLNTSDGFILHSSSVRIGNLAYIFIGKSTAGKSTVIRLLRGKYSALSDDFSVVRKKSNHYYFYQTPFIERNRWFKKNFRGYPISKIFFLIKDKNYKIVRINSYRKLYTKLAGQFSKGNVVFFNIDMTLKSVRKFTYTFKDAFNLYFGKNKNKLLKLLTVNK